MMGLSINARHRGLGFSDSPPEGAGRENVEGVHHANGRFSREENCCLTLTNDGYTMV